MTTKNRRFAAVDILLLAGAVLPLLCGMALTVLMSPAEEGIAIGGAGVYFSVNLPLMDLPVSEAVVNSALVIVSLLFLCLYLTHGIRKGVPTKRQWMAEWMVQTCENLVGQNMGASFGGFGPFVAAILGLSAFSSLLSLLGMYPPTSDLNITAGWAVLVFVLITYYKMKCGPLHYLKSFAEPVPLLAPLNIISEVATPVSMAFRHYGNILSGMVISVLVATALQGLTRLLLGWLPGVLGDIPFLQIGLPAVLSLYFDLFSGCLQAFIFAMLTMLYIADGFPAEEYAKRKEKTVK